LNNKGEKIPPVTIRSGMGWTPVSMWNTHTILLLSARCWKWHIVVIRDIKHILSFF